MPQICPIKSLPNQSFTISLDGHRFDIALRVATTSMAVSVSIDGLDILDNVRAVAGSMIIPYRYLEAGNFLFITANYDLPYYTKFNTSQFLIYFTADELAAYRAIPAPPLTADRFDPTGDLPLRFSPQGYV